MALFMRRGAGPKRWPGLCRDCDEVTGAPGLIRLVGRRDT